MPHHEPDHRPALSGAALIEELILRRATFAAFREPGCHAMAYVQHDADLRHPHAGQRCFVLAPFDKGEGAALCIRPDALLRIDEDGDALPGGASWGEPPAPELAEGLDRPGYHAAVARAIDEIRSGRLQKVVLARTIGANLGATTPGGLFQAACATNPSAFVAVARTDRFGLWLGASPERLLSIDGQQVEVDSLAGTLPADQAPFAAEAWGEKEREEQELVTAEIVDRLRSHGAREVRADAPMVKRAANVAHLHTRITALAAEGDALDLASTLHPTPAVGGRPSLEACNLIRSLEPRTRSLYAGYWGPLDAGRARFFVNIRCMEIAGDRALLHVGAGITADSVPERECDEVEQKARVWLGLIEEPSARR